MPAHDKSESQSGQHGSCLTQAGAGRLARQIEEFWAARGAAVAVSVERDGSNRSWIIRSDMVGGLPVSAGGQ